MPITIAPSLSHWTVDHIAAIDRPNMPVIPAITAEERLLPDHYLWDMWPVQCIDGTTAQIDSGILWMILSSPMCDDPEARHSIARIRLVHQHEQGAWKDLGDLLPDGFNLGSREWAGSAILDPATSRLTLYFTATGHAGETQLTFGQRLYVTSADVIRVDGIATFQNWSSPIECVGNCGTFYMQVDEHDGAPGKIKAFRDPAWFSDPAGSDYLVFAASMPGGGTHNGAIGIALADNTAAGGWRLLPPLLSADGLNNELERPHILHRDGLYYLFWSTHDFTFDEGGPKGPSGLYGMVAQGALGPYAPLNGTGLVAANPEGAPTQAYSWLVLDDLRVASFIDSPDGSNFIGTPAPMFSLKLDGDKAELVTP
ncbi:MAG: glycoside hydrolase family 68 protein [Pseudomonadota bacterium]